MKQTLIISVVGTSILTNAARSAPHLHTLIREHANQPTHAAVPTDDAAVLDALLARAADALASAAQEEVRAMSAELNTLLQLIADDPAAVRHHVLISTDTWLGHRCAEMVQACLQRCLSSWGELVWSQARPSLYGERLWPPPSARVVFGKQFVASTSDLNGERLRILNERLDDAARYVETDKPLRRLDLKPLKGNPIAGSTHEFDAWADADARRVFCHYENGALILDKLGKALH